MALLPIGCVEMHGPHLPAGTDAISAEGMAVLVAEREPSIIMPTLYYNINDEMMAYPGTIAISPETMLRLYQDICAEAARNGFSRIVLFVGHGGSEAVTDFLQHSLLYRRAEEPRGYHVFRLFYWSLGRNASVVAEHGPEFLGHGGGGGTSYIMRFRPDLVKLDRLPAADEDPGPYPRQTIPEATYYVDWIRRTPRGYHGAPELATPEKAAVLTGEVADEWARVIRAIKAFDPEQDR